MGGGGRHVQHAVLPHTERAAVCQRVPACGPQLTGEVRQLAPTVRVQHHHGAQPPFV